jgi:LuxR family maltose regulon positive regulatory protein
VQALPDTPENNRLKVELMVILCRLIAISGDSAGAIRMAMAALELLPDQDIASHARVRSALAIAYGLEGDYDRAEETFEDCFRMAVQSGYYSLAAHTAMVVGIAKARIGMLRKPERVFQEIIGLEARSGQKPFYPAGQAYIGLAAIALERNDLESAGQMVDEGILLCQQAGLDGVYSGRLVRARLRQARGDLRGALEEVLAVENDFGRKDHETISRQVQVLLAMGDVEAASRWIPPLSGMLAGDPAMPKVPPIFLEALKITLARILMARGETGRGLALLDEIVPQATASRRYGHVIEANLLIAAALLQVNQGGVPSRAVEAVNQALSLAEPEGFTLLFLEAGGGILPALDAISHQSIVDGGLRAYAAQILAAFQPRNPSKVTAGRESSSSSDELNDLSKRELEILHLIDAGCSNREIAGRLVITVETVKKHSSHIFAKLGVISRTQAVARARQLGLLE